MQVRGQWNKIVKLKGTAKLTFMHSKKVFQILTEIHFRPQKLGEFIASRPPLAEKC